MIKLWVDKHSGAALRPGSSSVALATLAAMICAGSASAADLPALDVAALKQRLLSCRGIEDSVTRTACYDRLADETAEMPVVQAAPRPLPQPASQSAPQQVASSGEPASPAPAAPALQATPQPTQPTQPQASRGITDRLGVLFGTSNANSVTLEVTGYSRMENGKISIQTKDGVTLNQTEDIRLRDLPRVGGEIIVTRTFLGGYWCKVSRRTVYHCKPICPEGHEE